MKKPRARKTRLKRRPILPSVGPVFLPAHHADCLCPFHAPVAREWSGDFKSMASFIGFIGLVVILILQILTWKEDEYDAHLAEAAKVCELLRGDRDAVCYPDGTFSYRVRLN